MKDYENQKQNIGNKTGKDDLDLNKKNRQNQDQQDFDKKRNLDPTRQAPNRGDRDQQR